MKKLLILSAACLALASCAAWTEEEKSLIGVASDGVMRVLTVDDHADSLLLRTPSADLSSVALKSPQFAALAERMVATVTSPEQDGVGIAGPQVGLLRRVVAVQRFDKEGEPFEVYPNIRVSDKRGPDELGGEGCLSVPGRRGEVLRSRDTDITYTSLYSYKDTTERVQGFTAVIFQHECDHLDGILYTDYID